MTTEELYAEVLRRWPHAVVGEETIRVGEITFLCLFGDVLAGAQTHPTSGWGATIDEALADLHEELNLGEKRLQRARNALEAL